MELYGRSSSGSDRHPQWVSGPGSEDSMGRLGREPGLFPVRPGFSDCVFYMRTGSCGYGAKCRYNHPRHRSSVGVVVRYGGEPPERPGEPACPFYLRTGTCKFGASCKFHHPRNSEAYINIRLNTNGYPLRPGERECSYYLRTGQCNFGIACKFHHPQLLNGRSMPPTSALPFYPSVQTPPGRPPPLLPGSYMPHGTFGPVLVPPGVVPIPSWSTYSGPVSPAMSSNAPPGGAGSPYGLPQLPSSGPGFASPYHTFSPSSIGPLSSIQKPNVFPVRPGQPDCQFYLKTGDCKFGSCCKFNHPPGGGASQANCAFSSLGLPLRPGVQPCSYYMKNGSCKFERTCKFDHPMVPIRYSPSASSLTDVPVAPYMVGSPFSTLASSFSYSELIPGIKPLTFLNGGTSSGNTSSSSVGLIFQPNGSAFASNSQTRSPLV